MLQAKSVSWPSEIHIIGRELHEKPKIMLMQWFRYADIGAIITPERIANLEEE